ncbi:MAG TPA: hypothetical protein VFE62_03345 [Gemmataceae bacterium]|nr:hypothetical protein [Gemmataceae bacterium]
MATINMQNQAVSVAKTGVRVTGLGCGSMPAKELQVPILSLPWHSLSGYPAMTEPEADRFADNAATARAVIRAGRSVSEVGSTTSARTATMTVLSKRSSQFAQG